MARQGSRFQEAAKSVIMHQGSQFQAAAKSVIMIMLDNKVASITIVIKSVVETVEIVILCFRML